jgi:hypothetical protein
MTRTQFVECAESGFWAHDVALGVFLKHLIDVADARSREPGASWLVEAVDAWRVVAWVGDYGLNLGETRSSAQHGTFLALAREACARIGRRERFLAIEMQAWSILDGRGVFARGASDVLAGPIVELGEAVIALVEGRLPPAPPGTAWLYGAPSGRSTIAMRRRNA